MPTVTDLAEQVETITHELRERVDLIDREQKKTHEELASKTGSMSAEHKTVIDRLQADINKLLDEVNTMRIAAQRPPNGEEENKSAAKKAFFKAIRSFGRLELLEEPERKWIEYTRMPPEIKAMYAGDATTGGFFATTDFVNELQAYKLLVSPMRTVARVQATSGEKVQMPSLMADTNAYWAVEQQSFTDSSDPTLGMINIPVHEMRGLVKISQQNLEDSMFDLEGLLKNRLGMKFAQLEGAAFISGNGVGKPRGFLNYPIKASASYPGGSAGKANVIDAIAYVPSGTAATITADNVISVLMDLKSVYAQTATWVLTRGTLGTIRLFKDNQNRPLWQPFAAGNLPATIYDRPYIEMPDMPEIAANAYPIAVGDFSNYMIVDRLTLNMQQLNELYAAQGLIGFIARMRVGGDLLLPEAFRVLKCAVS